MIDLLRVAVGCAYLDTAVGEQGTGKTGGALTVNGGTTVNILSANKGAMLEHGRRRPYSVQQ
jgi:hypothetical protein